MKIAFVCLTRGYNHVSKYFDLINRNKSISKYMDLLNAENVIFHEGNIAVEQQDFIVSNSCPTKFINLKHIDNITAFKSERKCKSTSTIFETNLSINFSTGYRHMCHFWTKDFIELVKDYDYIIRVDEDCVIKSFPINFMKRPFSFITPIFSGLDSDGVTIGLQETLTKFHQKFGTTEKTPLNACFLNPYTNVFIMNVEHFLKNTTFRDYIDFIDESDGIYINRWGDLPLLGYFILNFIDKDMYVRDTNITYYHKSHDIEVNKKVL